jgi:hypothetical protein
VRRYSRLLTAVAAALALATPLLAVTSCGAQTCAGQCGPPFQLQVVFRPGTSTPAAVAAMDRCADNPQVVRIGHRLSRFQGSPNPMEPAGSRTATIYTRLLLTYTRSQQRQQQRLLACLHQSPLVGSEGFPD